MLERNAFVVHVMLGRGPVDEIIRGAALYGPDPDAVAPGLFEVSAEDAVATHIVVPHGHVDRIEGALDLEGTVHDGFPDEPIGRSKPEQPVPALSADGLETLFGRRGRIAVQKDAEVVRLGAPDEDVVVRGALRLYQVQTWPLEMDAIVADQQVRRLRLRPTLGQIFVLARGVVAAVVHQDLSVVGLDQVVATRAGVLQWFDDAEDRLLPNGFVQVQACTGKTVDQVGIYKKFTLRSQVDGGHGWSFVGGRCNICRLESSSVCCNPDSHYVISPYEYFKHSTRNLRNIPMLSIGSESCFFEHVTLDLPPHAFFILNIQTSGILILPAGYFQLSVLPESIRHRRHRECTRWTSNWSLP